MTFPSFCRSPLFWFVCFAIWWLKLWNLSNDSLEPPLFEFAYVDKILHAGFFFGGAGLLSPGLYFLWKSRPSFSWWRLGGVVMIILTLTGCIDEWHQSWHPDRQGNDRWDLLADIVGGLLGFSVFRSSYRILLSKDKAVAEINGA